MNVDHLERIAELLSRRNDIDADLAAIIDRPMTSGHLGEWIAAQIFEIDLSPAANAPAIDGYFTSGDLAGKSVDVKWYPKRAGLLDMSRSNVVDYYLVLCGPADAARTSLGSTRPWRIDTVHLFDAHARHVNLTKRGIKVGTASSVRNDEWDESEVFPRPHSRLPLTEEQRSALRGFAFESAAS